MIHSNDSRFFERKRWAYELSTCTLQKNYSDTLELVQYLCQDWNFQPLKGHATLLTTEISLQPLQCKLYTNTVSLQVHYQIQCWGLTYLVYPCYFNFFSLGLQCSNLEHLGSCFAYFIVLLFEVFLQNPNQPQFFVCLGSKKSSSHFSYKNTMMPPERLFSTTEKLASFNGKKEQKHAVKCMEDGKKDHVTELLPFRLV